MCRIDGNFGGVERHILTVARRLQASQYKPVIVPIANHGELECQAKNAGIDTHFLPMKSRVDLAGASDRLLELSEHHQAAVIHTYGIRSNSLAWMISNRTKAKWAARVPNLTYTDYENRLIGKISHHVNNRFLRKADAIQVISPQVEQYYSDLRFLKNKLHLIQNGVDFRHYQSTETKAAYKTQFNIPENSFVLGSIGRMAPIKGYDLLLNAFAQIKKTLPNTHLVFVGDGPELESLKDLANTLHISESVIFTGYLEDIRPALWAFDLYVCSSRSEGVPHTILEAMAANVGVVSTNVGGIESVIRHNQNGLLFESFDGETIANTLTNLFMNKDQLAQYVDQAHRDVIDQYSEERMVKQVVELYDRITAQ